MGRNKMKMRNGANLKGWIFVILVCVLFSGSFAADVPAGECENAMARCMADPYWHMTLAGPVYCAAGYLFCKKYIEV